MISQYEQWILKEKWHGEKTEGFFTDCQRLKTGEPVAYIIGFVDFLGVKVYLDSKPLIPRTETEFWTAKAIEEIEKKHMDANVPIRVLDLCAGSGAIGLAVAKKFLNVQVDFIEIDAHHNSTINRSIEINKLDSSRIDIYNGDLFNALPITKKPPLRTYDYILSNPPYIDKELDRTESSVVHFEPHLALYGGFEGLELIENIIKTALPYLAEDGELWLEHEPEQSLAIQTLAEKNKMVTTVHKDQYNIARYSVLRMAQY